MIRYLVGFFCGNGIGQKSCVADNFEEASDIGFEVADKKFKLSDIERDLPDISFELSDISVLVSCGCVHAREF
jgi:hypothetical protein